MTNTGAVVSEPNLDQLAINTIRTLSMDAVQAANSGHPGTPMALAPVAYTLWQRFLRYDPKDPIWANRDRFVLSNAVFFAASRAGESRQRRLSDAWRRGAYSR